MPESVDIETVAAMSEAELFAAIGADLTGRAALPASQQELRERGKAWFKNNVQKLSAAVCPYAQKLAEETDTQKAIVAIADLIASVTIHIAPFKVAALIVKAGVRKLCDGESG
jgi:hypothetical protein